MWEASQRKNVPCYSRSCKWQGGGHDIGLAKMHLRDPPPSRINRTRSSIHPKTAVLKDIVETDRVQKTPDHSQINEPEW